MVRVVVLRLRVPRFWEMEAREEMKRNMGERGVLPGDVVKLRRL